MGAVTMFSTSVMTVVTVVAVMPVMTEAVCLHRILWAMIDSFQPGRIYFFEAKLPTFIGQTGGVTIFDLVFARKRPGFGHEVAKRSVQLTTSEDSNDPGEFLRSGLVWCRGIGNDIIMGYRLCRFLLNAR